MTDLAAKAIKNLSPAQAQFVKDGMIHGDFAVATIRALERKGLFHLVIDSPNGRAGFMRLTPLGEDVRALLTQSHGDGQ